MKNGNLTNDEANKAYDILVAHCGASEDNRFSFVDAHMDNSAMKLVGTSEWRINGNLGWGGKFRVTNDRLRVDCYQEDENPKRLATIQTTNEELSSLFKTFTQES